MRVDTFTYNHSTIIGSFYHSGPCRQFYTFPPIIFLPLLVHPYYFETCRQVYTHPTDTFPPLQVHFCRSNACRHFYTPLIAWLSRIQVHLHHFKVCRRVLLEHHLHMAEKLSCVVKGLPPWMRVPRILQLLPKTHLVRLELVSISFLHSLQCNICGDIEMKKVNANACVLS